MVGCKHQHHHHHQQQQHRRHGEESEVSESFSSHGVKEGPSQRIIFTRRRTQPGSVIIIIRMGLHGFTPMIGYGGDDGMKEAAELFRDLALKGHTQSQVWYRMVWYGLVWTYLTAHSTISP